MAVGVIRRLAVAVTLLGTLAACGGGSGDAKDDDIATDPCDAARVVAELDDEFQAEINDVVQSMLASPSQEESDAALVELVSRLEALDLEPLFDAYTDLEATLDGAPSEAAGTLRRFTERVVEDLRTAGSSAEVVELLEALGTDQGALAAGQAALDLDEWSRDTCDVVIAD